MNKFLLLLAVVSLSANASEISSQTYSQLFANYDACFILYSVNQHKILTEYNPQNRCHQRIAPDSTFKIALSLMAFDQGIITQDTIFKWDGKKREFDTWNQNLTPRTWLSYSAFWVSQQLTPQLGYARIKEYLARFKYGNQDFSGDPGKNNGLGFAWVSSSLKISALEQLDFLKAMSNHTLSISREAISSTKENMYLGKLANGADYFGKSGSGKHGVRDGWFIGYVEQGIHEYIFVSNITDKAISADISYAGPIVKQIALQLLNQYFASVA